MSAQALRVALTAARALGRDPRSTNLERVPDGYAFTWEADGRTWTVAVTEPGADTCRPDGNDTSRPAGK